MDFREKWAEAVEKKNSVLCAGLDPADFAMGRGEESLPQGVNKLDWARTYIQTVAPYCAAVKPNVQYWKNETGMTSLKEMGKLVQSLGLVYIDDSKLADIGSTNDAGLFHSKQKGFDAVTIAPYAGNMREAAGQARKRDIGAITMCLMSNPEYEREKKMLINVYLEREGYSEQDIEYLRALPFVQRYIQLAHDAQMYGIDGIVVGAPSPKNHIKEEEIDKARRYVDDKMLVLLPGVGAQGGEASAIWKHFGKDQVIVNVGRSLMFPNGSNSTSDEQAEAAKHYQEMLNELRKV